MNELRNFFLENLIKKFFASFFHLMSFIFIKHIEFFATEMKVNYNNREVDKYEQNILLDDWANVCTEPNYFYSFCWKFFPFFITSSKNNLN